MAAPKVSACLTQFWDHNREFAVGRAAHRQRITDSLDVIDYSVQLAGDVIGGTELHE